MSNVDTIERTASDTDLGEAAETALTQCLDLGRGDYVFRSHTRARC